MKKALSLLAVVFAQSVAAARANTIVLTFEGLQNLEPVTNYYKGGYRPIR